MVVELNAYSAATGPLPFSVVHLPFWVRVSRCEREMDSDLIDIESHDGHGDGDADFDVDIMESPTDLRAEAFSPEVTTPASAVPPRIETSERTTRSSSGVLRQRTLRPPPKLKLKLGEKNNAIASGNSFLGPYDRELDSDAEEDLVFEEQFLLRVPPGEELEYLRKQVTTRGPMADISFKFRGMIIR